MDEKLNQEFEILLNDAYYASKYLNFKVSVRLKVYHTIMYSSKILFKLTSYIKKLCTHGVHRIRVIMGV